MTPPQPLHSRSPDAAGPIRVAFCENGAGYGGAVISLVAMLEKLPAEFAATIYTSIGSADYQNLSRLGRWHHIAPLNLISAARLRRHAGALSSVLDNLLNLLPTALRYYRAFKRDRIQLVYLNNDASCNMAAAVAAKMANLPLVLHARGFNANTKGNRWVLSLLKHCMPVSTAIENELLKLGLTREKCTVVPEGLDLQLFHPRAPNSTLRRELAISNEAPIITLVAGLVDWKGQDVLLDACPLIFKKFPDAQILMVGAAYGKDDVYANAIAQRIATPALQGRVRLLGGRKDIPDLLSISNIVLHTSTKPEPFGRTFLEGMAMGKAVIASNEGGPLDVIEHEVDGLLIPPRDPVALANAVIRLLTDTVFAENLARNAAIKAQDYSIEKHVEKVCAVLRRVIAGGANK